ncbi:MAG: response regulator transcription factor [Flavobacteriales bacterium]|nr:response regulator transcription factor [Flavobacteriales bacterium]
MNDPVRVVLCDDHRIVTDGLRELLSTASDVAVVGVASGGEEALYLLAHLGADVLITDLDMPAMDGAALATEAKRRHEGLRVLVLSMHDEPATVRRLMELGVDGYLLKSAGRDELLLAVRAVHGGKRHFSSELLEAMMRPDAFKPAAHASLKELSEREVEVLAALAEGLGNKEIGERLFISPRTVDTHRTNLMRKLEVHNVAGLVRIAIQAGLVK